MPLYGCVIWHCSYAILLAVESLCKNIVKIRPLNGHHITSLMSKGGGDIIGLRGLE